MTSHYDHAQSTSTQTEIPMSKPLNANDNGNNDNVAAKPTTSVATTAKGSTALMSLAALGTALNGVDTSIGRSDKPMMFFKSREDIWIYGRQKIEPEAGSRWAANPTTFQRGYIAFDGSRKVDERNAVRWSAEDRPRGPARRWLPLARADVRRDEMSQWRRCWCRGVLQGGNGRRQLVHHAANRTDSRPDQRRPAR
jgi:hypothetical protein